MQSWVKISPGSGFLLLLYCCYLVHFGETGSGLFPWIHSNGTFDTYPRDCKRWEPRMYTSSEVITELKRFNVKSVWLPVERVNLTRWYWLDGTSYRERISNPAWTVPGRDCAVLRAGDKMVDDVACNNQYEYYICQTYNNTCSTMKYAMHQCIVFEDKTYPIFLSDRSLSWYDAKMKCTSKNMELASFPSLHKDAIIQQIAALFPSTWANIWIGLRLTEYKFKHDNNVTSLANYLWGEEQPCLCPEKMCVVLKLFKDGTYKWASAQCNETHPFLCISRRHVRTSGRDLVSVSSSPYVTTQKSPEPQHLKIILIASMSVGGVIVLAVVAVLSIVCCKRHGKDCLKKKGPAQDAQEMKEFTKDRDQPDGMATLAKETENQPKEPLLHKDTKSGEQDDSPPPYADHVQLENNSNVASSDEPFGRAGHAVWDGGFIDRAVPGTSREPDGATALPVVQHTIIPPESSISDKGGKKMQFSFVENTNVGIDQAGDVVEIEDIGQIDEGEWKLLIEALSRHFAATMRRNKEPVVNFLLHQLSVNKSVIRRINKTNNESTKTPWTEFQQIIQRWRGNKTTLAAWQELTELLSDSRYEMVDVISHLVDLLDKQRKLGQRLMEEEIVIRKK